MRLVILLMTALTTLSCGIKKEKLRKSNERLLYFNTKTVMEVDKLTEDEYYNINSDEFNDKTDTIKFTDNEIYISYLSLVNGCAEYSGDLQVKGDSIILDPFNIREYTCTEQRCDRVTFRIANRDNKKYIIKKW